MDPRTDRTMVRMPPAWKPSSRGGGWRGSLRVTPLLVITGLAIVAGGAYVNIGRRYSRPASPPPGYATDEVRATSRALERVTDAADLEELSPADLVSSQPRSDSGLLPHPIEPLLALTSDINFLLFFAIRCVESAGDDQAVGDGGRSLGSYQISEAYWRDACEWGGLDWDYRRYVWSAPHCEYIMALYWDRHDARTDEQKARCHNGGPDGPKLESTWAYWLKVKAIMEAGR